MKEKILALLTAKFSGVRKDGLTALARSLALQCTTDEEANGLVEKITDAQVNDFVKEYRADVDKQVSDGNKAFETNLKKKFDLVEKKKEGEPGTDPKPGESKDDVAALVKAAVAEAVKPLQDKLSNYDAETLSKARLQALNDKLNGCKDENFKAQALKDFARMKFDTDEEFNEYLADKEKDIATANQNVSDKNLNDAGGSPFFAQKTDEGVSKGVSEFIAEQKPDTNQFSGKEV